MKKFKLRPGEYLKAGTHNYLCFREEDFYKALSKVNKKLYDDEEGSYGWNEELLKQLNL